MLPVLSVLTADPMCALACEHSSIVLIRVEAKSPILLGARARAGGARCSLKNE